MSLIIQIPGASNSGLESSDESDFILNELPPSTKFPVELHETFRSAILRKTCEDYSIMHWATLNYRFSSFLWVNLNRSIVTWESNFFSCHNSFFYSLEIQKKTGEMWQKHLCSSPEVLNFELPVQGVRFHCNIYS